MSFLGRYGQKKSVQLVRDEVPESLRAGLIGILSRMKQGWAIESWGEIREKVCRVLRRRPNRDNWSEPNVEAEVEYLVYDIQWDEFYAICEVGNEVCGGSLDGTPQKEVYESRLNELLEEEGSPWRMKGGEVVPTFPEEVERVLDDASGVTEEMARPGAATHLRKARQHLSPSSGDPENAVKEAVSAVEAAVKEKSGANDLDRGLKLLKQQRRLKPHWSSPIQTVFQYASREDQIRHGSPDLSELRYEEARDLVGLAAVLTQHIADLPDPVQAR